MPDHGLGRLPFSSDERDYPVERLKAMIAEGTAVPLKWSVPRILDQGGNGTCVSAGTLGALDCDDETHTDPGFTSDAILPFFEKIAGHGALPGGGAEVREGLKAAKAAGYITAYSLLTTTAQIKDWQEKHGPVLFGADWTSAMESPDDKGYVTFGGDVVGGHCFYGNGDVGGQDFVNSWSDQWGDRGHFYMTDAEFARLQNGDFESWALVQAAPAPVPAPTPGPTSVKAELQAVIDSLSSIRFRCNKLKAGIAALKDIVAKL